MKRRSFLRTLMGAAATIVVAPASALAAVHREIPLPGLEGLKLRKMVSEVQITGDVLRRTQNGPGAFESALKKVYEATIQDPVADLFP